MTAFCSTVVVVLADEFAVAINSKIFMILYVKFENFLETMPSFFIVSRSKWTDGPYFPNQEQQTEPMLRPTKPHFLCHC